MDTHDETDHDHADEPIVQVFTEPHWSAVITFPNGNSVMVCDATTDGDVFEDAVVSVYETTVDRLLLRTFTRRPTDPPHDFAGTEVVGNARGTTESTAHQN